MKDFNIALKGALVGLSSYICGLNWELIIIWSILAGIDIITGILKATKKGNFYSAGMNSIYRKIGEFFLLIAVILGQKVALEAGINVPVSAIFLGAFCLKELGSIIENTIEMGVKIPAVITKWFKVANAAVNDFNDNNQGA